MFHKKISLHYKIILLLLLLLLLLPPLLLLLLTSFVHIYVKCDFCF
jgi:flagellar biosynthesis protein FliP